MIPIYGNQHILSGLKLLEGGVGRDARRFGYLFQPSQIRLTPLSAFRKIILTLYLALRKIRLTTSFQYPTFSVLTKPQIHGPWPAISPSLHPKYVHTASAGFHLPLIHYNCRQKCENTAKPDKFVTYHLLICGYATCKRY